jgi:oxygen-dependent protoporphyrinogen oxidase
MADVQVIGAGFSGLSAAYFLNRAGHRVRIVENAPRIGGLLDTLRTPYGPVETAANAVIANPVVESTARELGLNLTPALRSSGRRYIFREGRLRRWPLGPSASLRLLGSLLPIRFRGDNLSPLAPRARETVAAWGERALGAEATRYLLCPALSGVYAGNPAELSASLTVGKVFTTWRAPRSPRGKLRGSVAPLQGMGAWAPAFQRILLANRCTFEKEALPGMPTVVALPPPQAAAFLEGKTPALLAELRKIRMLPLLSVTIFLAPETQAIPGFGCLFPRGEKFRALGVLANDRIFPGRALDSISETWLFGGALDREAPRLSDSEILALVATERARLHGLHARVLYSKIVRWESAVPHYDLSLEGALENLRAMHFQEGLYRVFGTYLGELGLGAVLLRASKLAEEFP